MNEPLNNFQTFYRQKNTIVEGLLLSIILHGVVFFLLLSFSNFAKQVRELLTAEMEQVEAVADSISQRKVLVNVDGREETNQNTDLISTKSKRATGQIAPGDKQHVLGKTSYRGRQFAVSAKEGAFEDTLDSSKNNDQADDATEKGKETSLSASDLKLSLFQSAIDGKESADRQKLSSLPVDAKFAVESEISSKLQFWFDENGVLQLAAQGDENAPFLLELANNISEVFVVYLKSHGPVNHYFLKKDFVRVLIKIDGDGQVVFVSQLRHSIDQPYLNYLSENVIGKVAPISERPSQATIEKMAAAKASAGSRATLNTDIYLEVIFFYSGRPLRRWWLGFDFVIP